MKKELLCVFAIDTQTVRNIIRKNFMRYAMFKGLMQNRFMILNEHYISRDH